MVDGRRCVDKAAILEDSMIILFCVAAVYAMHIVGMPFFIAIDNYMLGVDSIVGPYTYSLSFAPTLSSYSFEATLIGFLVAFFLFLWLAWLQSLIDKYYPSCRELKKREKKRGVD